MWLTARSQFSQGLPPLFLDNWASVQLSWCLGFCYPLEQLTGGSFVALGSIKFWGHFLAFHWKGGERLQASSFLIACITMTLIKGTLWSQKPCCGWSVFLHHPVLGGKVRSTCFSKQPKHGPWDFHLWKPRQLCTLDGWSESEIWDGKGLIGYGAHPPFREGLFHIIYFLVHHEKANAFLELLVLTLVILVLPASNKWKEQSPS